MNFIEKRALVEKVLKTIIVRQSEIFLNGIFEPKSSVFSFNIVHDIHTVYHIHAY